MNVAGGAYFTTERHESLRAEVRAFAETEIRPQVAEMERSRTIVFDLARRIAHQGWLGVTIGKEYHGMGLGHLAKTIIVEEVSRANAAMGAMVQASQLGVAKIIHFGSAEQKQRWLPAVASGNCLPTIAVTEEESGGHVLGMGTTAVLDGNEWVLNGSKKYVGNSHVGDLHGVVARTGVNGSRSLTAFLVESTRPGFRLREHPPALGLHGFSFGELIFEDCRVPVGNVVGAVGQGMDVAYSSSTLYGRPNLTAVALGVHRALVEDTMQFGATRQRYGAPLAKLANIEQKLGQMQSRYMTARLTAYHAAHLLDRGLPCDAELMNAKVVNVESLLDSAREAMSVHGAAALFPADHSIERYLRDAYHIFAPAGTSDIQWKRLAEMALHPDRHPQWSHRLSELVRTGASEGLPVAGN